MQIETPKYELGDVVMTDQGKSLVMRREYCESINLLGRAFKGWIYHCAPYTKPDKKILTHRAACRYTTAMITASDDANVMKQLHSE